MSNSDCEAMLRRLIDKLDDGDLPVDFVRRCVRELIAAAEWKGLVLPTPMVNETLRAELPAAVAQRVIDKLAEHTEATPYEH